MGALLVEQAQGAQGPQGPAGTGGLSAFGYGFELATIADSTVVGGADVPFSNNGPLSGVTHTAGTTTFTVPANGTYRFGYSVTITAGVGAAMALAVNGSVDFSTMVSFVNATSTFGGVALMTLAAGDVVTLRNNSATPFTMMLAPAAGAQLTIEKVN